MTIKLNILKLKATLRLLNNFVEMTNMTNDTFRACVLVHFSQISSLPGAGLNPGTPVDGDLR